MLRRFETYGFAEQTSEESIGELARVLRGVGRFIPEVLDSAVGRNRSAAGVDLVWEHAYESPEAYARYMRHPYHICVLDRYLLPESPECITAPRRELALGLLGYEVDEAGYRRAGGVRRVVALRAERGATAADWAGFAAALEARATAVAGMAVSIVAANTMGLEWFPDRWTHVWEQAYRDLAAMDAAVAGEGALFASAPVTDRVDVHYVIDAGAPERAA